MSRDSKFVIEDSFLQYLSPPGGGGHFHIRLVGDVPTLGSQFFPKIPEQGIKFGYKFLSRHLKSLSFSRTGQIYPNGSLISEIVKTVTSCISLSLT